MWGRQQGVQVQHIFERGGVMLDVQYELDPSRVPTFKSIRVLGSDYKPTGPDLTLFLEDLVAVVGKGEGEHVLSIVAGEVSA
jgi:hypothetical protein